MKTLSISESEGLYTQKVPVTENQEKVIRDKYLKNSPSVEAWLRLICKNIALGELLYETSVDRIHVFKDVQHKVQKIETAPGQTSELVLLHHGVLDYKQRQMNFKKFMSNLYALADQDTPGAARVAKTEAKFYQLLSNWEFLPNSPTLMNAGRELQQLSACYVLPVPDSIEGIYSAVKNMAIIHKSGGGTGFSFSSLRPENDDVLSTHGVASGPLSFMNLFDVSTYVVRQGGTRRGANMGIMRYDHPDILKFIDAKKKPGVLENFNISVTVDDTFMGAIKNNAEYDLINPHTNQVTGKLNAKDVFNKMVQGAWETGDPGIIFIDRINNSNANATPHLGMIESTNPCGEQPLLPFEPCNLGSINLSKFIDEQKRDFDWEKLKECVFTSVHFLDNVITVNNYPLPEIEEISKGNRRIGLGVMGWAESLVQMRLPYNSPQALEKAEQAMKFVNDSAMEASEWLAKDRGIFPNFKNSIFDKNGKYFRSEEYKPRNCARTTIAPTGTIAITAGLQGSGIEPFFAIVYVRYNAAGVDALKAGTKPKEKDTFYEINPYFKKIAEEHNYFGVEPVNLWNKIEANHKAVMGIPEIPESIQQLFQTSHDLSPLDHVRIQAAFQKYTDNAVSKTVNMRNEALAKDVEEVYNLSYSLGCKGVTVYRDGSKSVQVLNLQEKKSEESKEVKGVQEIRHERRNTSMGESSMYYEIPTGYGPLHVHINYDEFGPTKIFANISPTGTEISGLTTALSILVSKYLGLGGDPAIILKHLNSIKGDKPYGFGQKRIDSIPHALSKALRDHLIKTGKLKDSQGQQVLTAPIKQQKELQKLDGADLNEVHVALYCPKCYSNNVEMLSGCSGPTCFDCGHSECS
ncbi:MAG: adenosylcobalamin-dependent ribonucleoside-diphosphate reductase [Nanoarchaeota archaeon]